MKALSLWQPWASAVVLGSKRIETRSWSTKYRGPLAIHATKRCVLSELTYLNSCWNWCGALMPLGRFMGAERFADVLPFGAIVGWVDLVDCRPTESFTVGELDAVRRPTGRDVPTLYEWTERQLGDFSPGRFGWVFENPQRLVTPIVRAGAQGLFNVPDCLLRRAATV